MHKLSPYLILFLTAVIMLGANPFANQTVAPMDMLQNQLGWRNTGIDTGTIHGERSDVLDQKLPAWISAKTWIYQGEFPFWSYSIKGGTPSYIFTNALLSPSFFVFVAIKDNASGFYFSVLINLIIGLFGMYFFLKIFLDRYSSVFGAITFMFCGFNTAWFFWPHVTTSIWTPWVLYTTFNFLKTGQCKHVPLMTLSMLMLNLGGFPFVAVMTYMALALMIITYVSSINWTLPSATRKLLLLVFAASLSVAIAAPFIYPLVEVFEWIGGLGYRQGGTPLRLIDMVQFVFKNRLSGLHVETTFYSGFIPFLFSGIAVYFYLRQRDFIAKFGLLLFLFATTIAFALIPSAIIRMVPTLSMNNWGRFSLLIGLSLAIVGAYSFNELTRRINCKKRRVLAISILLLFNVTDLKMLFNKFNGPVPIESFYPETKTIDCIAKDLKPFQYVLADHSYLVCGTLAAYNLNDWFAHTFRSEPEKKILNKVVERPFKTPTAALFDSSQIIFNSPYIDLLNIKYILSSSTNVKIALWDNNLHPQKPCPNLPFNKISQPLVIDNTIEINGINLLMATYGEAGAPGDVELNVYREKEIIASSTVGKNTIIDNHWASFLFGRNIKLEPGKYIVDVRLTNHDKKDKVLTIWSNPKETKHCLLVNNTPVELSLKMTLSIDQPLPTKYDVESLEKRIEKVENTNVTGSAYFLKNLTPDCEQNYENILVKQPSNREVEILYSGKEEGWVILPMSNYPGWSATINQSPTPHATFIGMLPAFRVNGKSTIIFEYTPTQFNLLLAISCFGISTVLICAAKFWQTKL